MTVEEGDSCLSIEQDNSLSAADLFYLNPGILCGNHNVAVPQLMVGEQVRDSGVRGVGYHTRVWGVETCAALHQWELLTVLEILMEWMVVKHSRGTWSPI